MGTVVASINNLSEARELYKRHLAGEKISFVISEKPAIPPETAEAMAKSLAMLQYIGKVDIMA